MAKGDNTKIITLDDYFNFNSKEESDFKDSIHDHINEINLDELEEESIDINDFGDYVKIIYNPKIDKHLLEFFNDGNLILSKSFKDIEMARVEAVQYLKEIGINRKNEDNELKEHDDGSSLKRKRSHHRDVYYSPSKGKWGAKVRGFKGSKFLGYYNSEREAYLARKAYLDEKEKVKEDMIREKKGIKSRKSETDMEGIIFSKQSGKWLVRLKDKNGKYVNLGKFDSEEEAVFAKEEFLSENFS